MFLTAQLSLLPEKKKKRKVNNITIHVYHLSATSPDLSVLQNNGHVLFFHTVKHNTASISGCYSSIIEMPKVTVQPFQISDPSS